jgi:hypothetical protein
VRKLLPLALLLAACGSTTRLTKTASTAGPTVPSQALTPSTSGTSGTSTNQTPASCGSAAQGGASQISGTGVSCATAQQVATTYVKTIQGGSPAPSIISVGGTQFTCSSVSQSQSPTVSCDAPGNPGAVVFKAG